MNAAIRPDDGRSSRSRGHLRLIPLLALVAALRPGSAPAADDAHWCPAFLASPDAPAPAHRGEFTFSPYTHHWTPSPEHRNVVLAALDEQLPGDRFCGAAVFKNSFGQASAYLYAGQQWNNLFGVPGMFAKVSAGILYGYTGQFKDKVPLNRSGFSPGLIPAIGYRFNEHDSVQVMVLGTAGLMFGYGRSF